MGKIIVANWKQHGTPEEGKKWVDQVTASPATQNKVIVCPPFTLLYLLSHYIKEKNVPLALGSQTVSHFEEGKFTGEVSAKMLAEFASYGIIGHSERRINFGETDGQIFTKIELAKKYGLTPIVCVSDISQVESMQKNIGNYADIIAYEPLFAVGTGSSDTPGNANDIAQKAKVLLPQATVIYGGSVDGNNVESFLQQEHISGVLVGHRSFDPTFFVEILHNAH